MRFNQIRKLCLSPYQGDSLHSAQHPHYHLSTDVAPSNQFHPNRSTVKTIHQTVNKFTLVLDSCFHLCFPTCGHRLSLRLCFLCLSSILILQPSVLNFFSVPGVRQEQDIFVRLIDSVTKQVSQMFKHTFYNNRCTMPILAYANSVLLRVKSTLQLESWNHNVSVIGFEK